MKLKDATPREFTTDFKDVPAYKHKDVEVLHKFEDGHWIGTHKNVHVWYALENGYAVGWNENPSTGWSFPVKKMSGHSVNVLRWANALNSGDYMQTRNTLRDGDSFCCLGVLCDISGVGEWHQDTVETESDLYSLQKWAFGCDSLNPPPSVWRWLTGIDKQLLIDIEGILAVRHKEKDYPFRGIHTLNDIAGLSFSCIAEMLYKTVSGEVQTSLKPLTF